MTTDHAKNLPLLLNFAAVNLTLRAELKKMENCVESLVPLLPLGSAYCLSTNDVHNFSRKMNNTFKIILSLQALQANLDLRETHK